MPVKQNEIDQTPLAGSNRETSMDYTGIRVWHVWNGAPGAGWRELQKRAAREGAPVDALFLNAEEKWITARDFAPDHAIHAALALDLERCRRGFNPKRDKARVKSGSRERNVR
jgi:hypothetical protein